MKHNKPLRIILITSLLISVLGFILDLKEHDPNLVVNFRDILVITALLFVVVSSMYFLVNFIFFKTRVGKNKS